MTHSTPVHRFLRSRRATRGATLLELLVAIVVVATLAGLVIRSTTGTTDDAREQTTMLTLKACRDGIVGSGSGSIVGGGFLADMLDMPETIADLLRLPAGASAFDPATGLGWRGPYVRTTGALFEADLSAGIGPQYGTLGDPAIKDGWDQLIVLQFPDADGNPGNEPTAEDRLHARLISAGADGVIQTPFTNADANGNAHYPPLSLCGDDRVLYVRVSDQRSPTP